MSYYKDTQVCNMTAWKSDIWVLPPFYLDQLLFSYIACLSFPTGFRDKSKCMTAAEINQSMLRAPIIVPRPHFLELLSLYIMNIFYLSSKCVRFFFFSLHEYYTCFVHSQLKIPATVFRNTFLKRIWQYFVLSIYIYNYIYQVISYVHLKLQKNKGYFQDDIKIELEK